MSFQRETKLIREFIADPQRVDEASASDSLSDYIESFDRKLPPYKHAWMWVKGAFKSGDKILNYVGFRNIIMTDDAGKRYSNVLIVDHPSRSYGSVCIEVGSEK